MQITQPTETAKTEVAPEARRRSFTTEYKLSILERADRCKNGGDVGRLLRQEGLYSSHLTTWRSARREGTLKALGRKRGPKAGKSAEQLELERLQRENERLRKKLAHAERILDVQKKLSEVLGVPLQGDEDETNENS